MKKIISLLVFIGMIVLFIYFGTKDYNTDVSDNVRFSEEYNTVSKDNKFIYSNEDEILNILNQESGILFFGFPSNNWSKYYATYLNEAVKDYDLDKIYYYNFKKDRELNNNTYNAIALKLKDYLIYDDYSKANLSAPTIIIVKEGNILFFKDNNDIKGDINPEDYFTDYRKNAFIEEIKIALDKYIGDNNER